jgi:hypothetical protein
MESESCELYIAAGIDLRENSGQRQRRMVVNLKNMEARNIVVKPAVKRASMFVRYRLRSGDGDGNNVAVNTREVMATPDPQWKQTFCSECSGNLCDFQKQFVMFELRQRRRIKLLGISMFKSSKVVGWVQIPWKDLLASPTLSIDGWFPLVCTDMSHIIIESLQPPSLHLAISVGSLGAVDSVSRPPQQDRLEIHARSRIPRVSRTKVADVTSWEIESDPDAMIWKMESSRNANMNMTVDTRVRRLERCDRVECGGKVGCQGLHEESIFGML